MADALKVLGQANPSATVLTDLYTVPGSTSTTVSTIAMCNRGAATISVRVSVAIGGASDSLEQYIIYDRKVLKNNTDFLTIGLTLTATDKVRVYTDIATASFSLFGVEIS